MTRKLMRSLAGAFLVCSAILVPIQANAQEATPVMEYRKSVMNGIRAHQGALGAILDAEVPHRGHVLGHAIAIQQLATMSSDVFPEGSHGEGSRALPAIWEDRAGFSDALTEFQSAADALLEAARSGNDAAIAEGFESFRGTCAGCHRPFRARASG